MKKANREFVAVSSHAVRTLRQERGKTVPELAALSGLSKNTITNVELGKTRQMLRSNADQLAKSLNVKLAEILSEGRIQPAQTNPILGTLGIRETPASRPDEMPWQDYVFTERNQPIAFEWADSRTDYIVVATVMGTKRIGHCLKVYLGSTKGGQGPLPGSVGIHCQDHVPRQLLHTQSHIGFAAAMFQSNNRDNSITLAVRFIDRKGREWVYGIDNPAGTSNLPHQFRLIRNAWTHCIVELTPRPTGDNKWHLFRKTVSDTSEHLRPDWSAVARVIIEFGIGDPTGHASAGHGRILISQIWLGSRDSIAARLPSGVARNIDSDFDDFFK